MQKMNFEEPKLNVIVFEAEDVITASLPDSGQGGNTSGGYLGEWDQFLP